MGNIIDDFGNVVHGIENTAVNAFDSVAKDLMNLGLPGVPNYIIQLFLDEGWAVTDIPGEILRMYQVISAAGVDFVSAIEQFVAGSVTYGSPTAYIGHAMRTHYHTITGHLGSMVADWKRVGQTPLDMLSDLDSVLAGFGTMPGTQGATTAAYMQQYSSIKAQIVQLAQPMASSPWDGKDYGQQLDDFWNNFLNQSSAALESEIHDGTMGLRVTAIILLGVAVYVVAFMPTAAISIAGTPFTLGASDALGAVAIGGILLLYALASMAILNILEPFIVFLMCVIGMLVDMLIVAPVEWIGHEIQLAFANAAQLTQQEIKDLADATGIAIAIIEEWARMGLTVDQILEAAALYEQFAALGLTAYDAGRLAQSLTPAQLLELVLVLPSYLALFCGGILGMSDLLIQIMNSGVNPFDFDTVARENSLFRKVFDLIKLANSGDLGARRVLGVLNKIGLQNVEDIDDPTISGGRGADIVLKGNPPVAIEVGGKSKVGNDPQYDRYIDEYGKGNVRAYLQNDNGDGDTAVKEAENKLGKDNVEQFTQSDLKCAH